MEKHTFRAFSLGQVRLLPGLLQRRSELNRQYLMSLRNEALLQNFYQEAGLWAPRQHPTDCHWGWETPTCQVRGHFLGHWLSAAARSWAATRDAELKAKADHIVAELGRCQEENGGEWAGSIPPHYLEWAARGKRVWAPHYTLHKTLMGLYEMATLAGSDQALDILEKWSWWFLRWTARFSRQQMDQLLDVETGGMLEVWADLFGLTGKEQYLELLRRYDRPRLFDRLLAGEDVLTNRHANTTVPEVQGAARAWEVTGEARWRKIVDAYWRMAVSERGYYVTGGQTNGEFWTPPHQLSARLSDTNQEHCVVYNMMRLADILYRWTGDPSYADYWERNLYNGILAQQHGQTGMVAYFLPMRAGATKHWGTPTEDFWCCHGTLVQAHPSHGAAVFYANDAGLVVSQYIPARLTWQNGEAAVQVSLTVDPQVRAVSRPDCLAVDLAVESDQPVEFTLQIRLPWWLAGVPVLTVNGEAQEVTCAPTTFATVRRVWNRDRVRLELPRRLVTCPLPDRPDTVAFMDGPVVLAGLCDDERTLVGDPARPADLLIADNEREFDTWFRTYRATGQERGLRFKPLYEVTDERYTVYFPLRAPR